MKKLALIAVSALTLSSLAFADGCKVLVDSEISSLEENNGITIYDYKNAIENLGHEVVDKRDDAEVAITLEVLDENEIGGYAMFYGFSSWDIGLDWIPDEHTYKLQVKNYKTLEFATYKKTITGNLRYRKVNRKLKGLLRNLPKDC